MHAVIRTGGKQYYVTAGDILEVEKLAGEIGDTITFDDILMVANDADVTVGQPTVAAAAVTARITGQYRGNKILVFRYRPKKRIRVRRGHRQLITRLEIQSIKLNELEFTAPVKVVAPPPVVEEPVMAPIVTEAASAPAEETMPAEEAAPEAVTTDAADTTAARVEPDAGEETADKQ